MGGKFFFPSVGVGALWSVKKGFVRQKSEKGRIFPGKRGLKRDLEYSRKMTMDAQSIALDTLQRDA